MEHPNKKHLALKIILAITILLIMALSFLLVRQYQQVQRLGYLHNHRQSLLKSLHGSGLLTASDAGSIQSWMTFDYIDRAFLLPPSYIQTSLDITDSRFPRMTISEYAKDKSMPTDEALSQTEDAVRSYFSQKQ